MTCRERPVRRSLLEFYDPDSPSNAIDYSQLASFVFPKHKDDTPTNETLQDIDLTAANSFADNVIPHHSNFEDNESFVKLELDFSKNEPNNCSQSKEEQTLNSSNDTSTQYQVSHLSTNLATIQIPLNVVVTIMLVLFQQMLHQTILTLSLAIFCCMLLSLVEDHSRRNESLAKANARLKELIRLCRDQSTEMLRNESFMFEIPNLSLFCVLNHLQSR
ncbi:hypothetical protein C9374_010920 [Naegleria lovaniensis]|uniref:Uncharacterized protein n=1 Tax=Naegleria lovaniensis TaxID=51637 RepID=A0AA88GF61_NAELO|nr:uncharacterized protein C9374_010920 [Naegleria lovaniensis]KAG2374350.1 hypothetical protein C9374_010920 [Naegleria lovaniensis]